MTNRHDQSGTERLRGGRGDIQRRDANAPNLRLPRTGAPGIVRGAVVGLLTAAVALGVAQLVAALTDTEGSPVVAVGRATIDLTPRPVTEFAIKIFGTHDKQFLLSVIIVLLAVFAAGFGAAALRRLAVGLAGLVVFGAIGLLAVATRPDFMAAEVAPTLAGTAVGAYVLVLLAQVGSPGAAPAGAGGAGRAGQHVDSPATFPAAPQDRRSFLVTGTLAAAGAAASGGLGYMLSQRSSVSSARRRVRIPPPAHPAPPLAATDDLRIPGLSPFMTSDSHFYRVDTALLIPQVNPDSWRLRIHGMVDRELEITFGELLRRPLTEADITLNCVSNPVGGHYIGNARWIGVPLAGLLREAGVKAGADQVLSTSTDGYTSGTPVATVLDGRKAMLAVAMNGEALPIKHGFPVRMIVPGLYGYVSATKWITDIKLTTFAAEQGYWIPRGWAVRGPVKTQSRIDVPSGNTALPPGRAAVAGVAWAQHRGIAAVQVRVDGGPWHEATLATYPGIDTWRQWVWYWDATPGTHHLQVRATDNTGYTQTPVEMSPNPSGATGWHTVKVSVSA